MTRPSTWSVNIFANAVTCMFIANAFTYSMSARSVMAEQIQIKKRIFPIISHSSAASLELESSSDDSAAGSEGANSATALHQAATSAQKDGTKKEGKGTEATEFITWSVSSSKQKTGKGKKLKRDPKTIVNVLPKKKKKNQGKGSAGTVGPLYYRGGALMVKNVNVYFIYYGNWPSNSGQRTLESFITDIYSAAPDTSAYTSPRKWWALNLPYYQTDASNVKSYITPKVTLTKVVYDSYSKGKALTDTNIWQVVVAQLNSGALPVDDNGVYFVLVSKDVTATSGMCTKYCGWHTADSYNGRYIKYSFIGNSEQQCPGSCGPRGNNLSGFPGPDNMISVLAHELTETATDPIPPTGWTAASGDENADLCGYIYGDNYLFTSSGSKYNAVGPSGLKYLVQANYDIPTQSCRMVPSTQVNYPSPPPPSSRTSSPPPPTIRKPSPSPPPLRFPPPPQGSGSCQSPGYACGSCKEYSLVQCGCTQSYRCVNTCAYWGYPGICSYSSSGRVYYGCISRDFRYCLGLRK